MHIDILVEKRTSDGAILAAQKVRMRGDEQSAATRSSDLHEAMANEEGVWRLPLFERHSLNIDHYYRGQVFIRDTCAKAHLKTLQHRLYRSVISLMNSIRDHVLECLQGFTALRDALKGQEGLTGVTNLADPMAVTLAPSQVQSEEVRFKVWCGNIGAHQTGTRSSLEYRLRDASHIRKQVVRILASLNESLVDGKPDQATLTLLTLILRSSITCCRRDDASGGRGRRLSR